MSALYGSYRVALTAATATTGGAAGSFSNPEGARIIVYKAVLDVPTPSTGAAALDIGITTTATTSVDNLIDGCSVATAGAFDNVTDKGTNGKSRQVWAAADFLTVTASATLAGLVGYLHIWYTRTVSEA